MSGLFPITRLAEEVSYLTKRNMTLFKRAKLERLSKSLFGLFVARHLNQCFAEENPGQPVVGFKGEIASTIEYGRRGAGTVGQSFQTIQPSQR